MKEIWGKMVYERIDEIVEPKHTALLVIDMQNDHGPRGYLAKIGRDVGWVMDIVPRVKKVLAEARRRKMLVIYCSVTISKDHRMESPAQIRFLNKSPHILGTENYEVEDTWGHEVLEELERRPDEPWIVKYRSSAFHGTRLDLLLRNSGIESVVVTGLVTEGCVEATVRDILGYGYYPVVLRDCVASSRKDLHDAALLVMSARYDVIPSADLMKAWSVETERATAEA
jgi:nicotinamidase-related amidase